MKKVFAILFTVLLATVFLSSCGSAGGSSGTGGGWDYAVSAPMAGGGAMGGGGSAAPVAIPQSPASVMPADGTVFRSEESWAAGSGIVQIASSFSDSSFAEKIIYTVNADIETLKYDDTIRMVYEMLSFHGAFIESSHVGGRNLEHTFYGIRSQRQARFSLRVPKDRLNAFETSLDDLGNVTSHRSDAQNITAQFSDTQSRLSSLRTQEERLLDMLGRAENVEEMLTIEDRLAGVRYQIEALTSSLRNWQNQVDYSTVNLFITEVEVYTEVEEEEEEEPEPTYWQQIGTGITDSAKSVAGFFTGLFKWVAINLPVLGILAIIIAGAIFVARKKFLGIRKVKDRSPGGYSLGDMSRNKNINNNNVNNDSNNNGNNDSSDNGSNDNG